eukprot:TRINITY_DN88_c0_g2_i1.p1 TRINITY_DN88_c0_g2~~TRINITY_DN88_c0_g2_i1.p1  ORF type:complete len:293 (-),score=61.24 TRINITY_DN88_c0_g2_i1:54-932(-)
MTLWCVVVTENSPATVTVPDDQELRICRAALAATVEGANILSCRDDSSEQSVVLGTLRSVTCEQFDLQIGLQPFSAMTFSLKGKGEVHVSGFYLPYEMDEDYDDSDDFFDEESDDDEDDDEEDQEMGIRVEEVPSSEEEMPPAKAITAGPKKGKTPEESSPKATSAPAKPLSASKKQTKEQANPNKPQASEQKNQPKEQKETSAPAGKTKAKEKAPTTQTPTTQASPKGTAPNTPKTSQDTTTQTKKRRREEASQTPPKKAKKEASISCTECGRGFTNDKALSDHMTAKHKK